MIVLVARVREPQPRDRRSWMLAASRFLLGAGEGGGFPAATKVIAEWFPVAERSTAMGIVNAGTAVGAVVAPPAIAAILLHASWRWVFVACGAAGLLWAVVWAVVYRTPHDGTTDDVADAGANAVDAAPDVPAGLGSRRREVPHRRRVVLLHLLAAEVPLRRARLRREAGRRLRVGAVRGVRRRQSASAVGSRARSFAAAARSTSRASSRSD